MPFTRFVDTDKIIVDGVETYGQWKKPSWLKNKPKESQILTYQVPSDYEGRPDLISNAIYGTPFLDWVLIAFNATFYPTNNSRLVLNWPRSGDVIKYPLESLVFSELI